MGKGCPDCGKDKFQTEHGARCQDCYNKWTERQRYCYLGRQIITEDNRVCPNLATHYFVDTFTGVVLELCTECACWTKMIRESKFGPSDRIIILPFAELDSKNGSSAE